MGFPVALHILNSTSEDLGSARIYTLKNKSCLKNLKPPKS